MKPDKCRLIHDLLDDLKEETRREATFLAGGRLLRHKRWKRAAVRSLAVAVLITMAAIPLINGPSLIRGISQRYLRRHPL
jgi:hypothetical protein